MTDVQIDVEAAEVASTAFVSILDTIGTQYGQHNQAASTLEGLLSSAASAIAEETLFAKPLSHAALDPYTIWDRWGFGGVIQSCLSTQSALGSARSSATQTVNELCDAHRGQLAPILRSRASSVQSSIDNALSSLLPIFSVLTPGNILGLISSPWSISELFSASLSALRGAEAAVQDYAGFVAALGGKESTLVEEIMLLLTSPGAGVALVVENDPGLVHSPAVKEAAKILGDLDNLAGMFGDKIPHSGGPLAILSFVTDVVSGGNYSLHSIAGKAGGAAIGFGIQFVPGADVAYDALGFGSAGAGLFALVLSGQAGATQGQTRVEIEDLSKEWNTESQEINPGPISDDLGSLAMDIVGQQLNQDAGGFNLGIGDYADIHGDWSQTVKDAGSLITGLDNLPELGLNTGLTEADIWSHSKNAPTWAVALQPPLDWATGPGKSTVDTVAKWVLVATGDPLAALPGPVSVGSSVVGFGKSVYDDGKSAINAVGNFFSDPFGL